MRDKQPQIPDGKRVTSILSNNVVYKCNYNMDIIENIIQTQAKIQYRHEYRKVSLINSHKFLTTWVIQAPSQSRKAWDIIEDKQHIKDKQYI